MRLGHQLQAKAWNVSNHSRVSWFPGKMIQQMSSLSFLLAACVNDAAHSLTILSIMSPMTKKRVLLLGQEIQQQQVF